MPLHPDIEAYLDLVEMGRMSGKSQPMHTLEPDQARADFEGASMIMDTGPTAIHCQPMVIPARDNAKINTRLYSREAFNTDTHTREARPVLIYFHGGGYVVGSLDSHDGLCRHLASYSDMLVLSVDYRLAPEYLFPTAIYDAEDVVNWVANHSQALGIDPARLSVGGDSAGASIATVLAISAEKVPGSLAVKPCQQLLLYPTTDATRSYASHERFATGHLLETQTLHWFYQHYARHERDKADWRFSPLLANDLSGIAPAIMVLPEYDPLFDEGKAYADRLEGAGVELNLSLHAGMTHDFLRMSALVPSVTEVLRKIAQDLSEQQPSELTA